MAGRPKPGVTPLSAGIRCRCPRCGDGSLFEGLLTVRVKCLSCGLDLRAHDTGDGPAVFVIFILGFLIVLLAYFLERFVQPPLWVHILLWTPSIVGLSILLLRPFKATLVALHYKNLRHEYHDG